MMKKREAAKDDGQTDAGEACGPNELGHRVLRMSVAIGHAPGGTLLHKNHV